MPNFLLRDTTTSALTLVEGTPAFSPDVPAGTYNVFAVSAAAGTNLVKIASTVPDAYAGDSWALLGDGTVRVYTVVASAAAITKHQYQVDTGAGFGAAVDIVGTTAGDYSTTAANGDIVQIRAVSANGDGAWSQSRTVGDQLSYIPTGTSDLTSRWVTGQTLVYSASPGPRIGLSGPPDSSRYFFSLDTCQGVDLSNIADVDVICEFDWSEEYYDFSFVTNGSGAAASETGNAFRYVYTGAVGSSSLRHTIYNAGSPTSTPATSSSLLEIVPGSARVLVRYQKSGSTIRFKTWPKAEAEPASWQRELASGVVTAGGRLGTFTQNTASGGFWLYSITIGLNGAVAPLPA